MPRTYAQRLSWAVALLMTVMAGNAAAQGSVTTVMGGLDNPRGLAFGPEGGLYVVEAGRGGSTCVPWRGTTFCHGSTGALTRLWRGTQERRDGVSFDDKSGR
jgi:glucose/arabinose dehydrogenase